MAGRLLRCRRCRQPVLADARCCPHCAVSRPIRALRVGRILAAACLVAAIGGWLQHTGSASIAKGVSSVVDGATTALKAVDARFHSPPAPPDPFAAACAGRGGTVVEVRSSDDAPLRRCATAFDDGVR